MPLHTIPQNTNVDPHLLQNPSKNKLQQIIRNRKLEILSKYQKKQELLNIDPPNNKIAIPDDYYSENYDVTYNWPSPVEEEQKQISETYTLTLDDLTLLIKQNPKQNEQLTPKISIDELQFQELLFITTDNDKTMCLTPHGLYLYSIYHLLMVQLLNPRNVKQEFMEESDFIKESVMGTISTVLKRLISNNANLENIQVPVEGYLTKISSNNNEQESQGGKNTTSNSKYSREQISSYEDKSSPKHSRAPMVLRKFAKQGKLGSRKLRLTSNTKNSILTRKKQKRILGGNSLGDFLGHLSNAGFRLFMRTLTCSTIRVMNMEQTTLENPAPFTPIIPYPLYRNRGISPEVVPLDIIQPSSARRGQVVPENQQSTTEQHDNEGPATNDDQETNSDNRNNNNNTIQPASAYFVEPIIGVYVSSNDNTASDIIATQVENSNSTRDNRNGLTFAVNIQRMKHTIEIYTHIFNKLTEVYAVKPVNTQPTDTLTKEQKEKQDETEYLFRYLRKKIEIITKFYNDSLKNLIFDNNGNLVESPKQLSEPSPRSVDILKIFSRIASAVNELIIILDLSRDDYIIETVSNVNL